MARRKPSYPLAAVMDQLRAVREQRQAAVVEAVAQVGHAEAELTAARQYRETCQVDLSAARSRMAAAISQGAVSTEIQRWWRHVDAYERALSNAEAACEAVETNLYRARRQLRQTRGDLVEADQRLQLQEKHREQWSRKQRAQQARREQNEEAETARMVHQRQQRRAT